MVFLITIKTFEPKRNPSVTGHFRPYVIRLKTPEIPFFILTPLWIYKRNVLLKELHFRELTGPFIRGVI